MIVNSMCLTKFCKKKKKKGGGGEEEKKKGGIFEEIGSILKCLLCSV